MEDSDTELERIKHEKMKQLLTRDKEMGIELPGGGKPIYVESVEQFKEFIEKYKEAPIVVDFWAEWCGPCRMLAPVYEKAAEHFKDRVIFLKVDSDKLQSLAAYFRVSSIPLVILIHQQEVKASWIGLRPFEFYTKALDDFLKTIE